MKTLSYVLALAGLFQSGMAAPRHEARPLRIRANVLTPNQASRIIPVVVGGPQDLFVPNLIRAKVGDIVQFQFSNGNHTVTQGIEGSGCQPLQKSKPDAVHSGHLDFQNGDTNVKTFNLLVSGLDPMLLYCATGPHCQTGQVMAINPRDEQQLINYMRSSQQAKENVDAGAASGGVVGQISLQDAAFIPAPPEEG